MRDEFKRVRDFCLKKGRRGKRKGKKSIVRVITSDRVIQAGVTSSFIGMIMAFTEGFAITIMTWVRGMAGWIIPAKYYMGMMMVAWFSLWYWVSNHRQEYRDFLEDLTGEEAAQDEEMNDE